MGILRFRGLGRSGCRVRVREVWVRGFRGLGGLGFRVAVALDAKGSESEVS